MTPLLSNQQLSSATFRVFLNHDERTGVTVRHEREIGPIGCFIEEGNQYENDDDNRH
jgi:hypothetical protein